MPVRINLPAWKQMAKEIANNQLVERMQRVADACNEQAGLTDGYRVGIEGDDTLTKHDERMTVITATAEAIVDNARTNRLVQNFHLAGGD